jgi:hypothetical protein
MSDAELPQLLHQHNFGDAFPSKAVANQLVIPHGQQNQATAA